MDEKEAHQSQEFPEISDDILRYQALLVQIS